MSEKFKGFVLGAVLAFLVSGILIVLFSNNGIVLEKPDQELINEAIKQTEEETGSRYTLIPLYIETGEHIGFLSSINNSGKYMYLGTNDYPSIFQERNNWKS